MLQLGQEVPHVRLETVAELGGLMLGLVRRTAEVAADARLHVVPALQLRPQALMRPSGHPALDAAGVHAAQAAAAAAWRHQRLRPRQLPFAGH